MGAREDPLARKLLDRQEELEFESAMSLDRYDVKPNTYKPGSGKVRYQTGPKGVLADRAEYLAALKQSQQADAQSVPFRQRPKPRGGEAPHDQLMEIQMDGVPTDESSDSTSFDISMSEDDATLDRWRARMATNMSRRKPITELTIETITDRLDSIPASCNSIVLLLGDDIASETLLESATNLHNKSDPKYLQFFWAHGDQIMDDFDPFCSPMILLNTGRRTVDTIVKPQDHCDLSSSEGLFQLIENAYSRHGQ